MPIWHVMSALRCDLSHGLNVDVCLLWLLSMISTDRIRVFPLLATHRLSYIYDAFHCIRLLEYVWCWKYLWSRKVQTFRTQSDGPKAYMSSSILTLYISIAFPNTGMCIRPRPTPLSVFWFLSGTVYGCIQMDSPSPFTRRERGAQYLNLIKSLRCTHVECCR